MMASNVLRAKAVHYVNAHTRLRTSLLRPALLIRLCRRHLTSDIAEVVAWHTFGRLSFV